MNNSKPYTMNDLIEISGEECKIIKIKNNHDMLNPKMINSQKITAKGLTTGCVRVCLVTVCDN